ncbi:MAG: beta-galactosidase, partial [Kiritimatiellae bacterium]|nr:beta-galactosidase [Kiritimatiellia bacterium]
NRAPRQSLKLVTREALPKAEGELAGRKLHVFAKTKSPQRVLLFTDDLCADWIAEDLEKQFGFRTDVIWRGQTWEPETVQARFDRGEYVLFLPGANPITLEKTPHSAIAEYIRRGGRAVYVSPRRGGTWGRPIPFPEGIPYDRISPKGLKDYGIACLSSGPLGQGTVVELGLNVRISRSGIWPSVDEVFLSPELHDFEAKAAGFPYNEYYSLLYADLILGKETEIEPVSFLPDGEVVPRHFDSKQRYVAAGYLWIAIPYRKIFYPVMRDIGLNCLNCFMPGAYDAAKHGWPWTDGWGGIMENPDDVVGAALQEQGIWGRKSYGDDPVKKHWRSGCLSDPKWTAAARKSFQNYAAHAKDNPPFQYAITDEMTLSAPWMNYHAKDSEPCRMPHCMARFRKAMAEKYRTIDALNRKWGTAFKSFGEVEPSLTEAMREGRRAGRRNYAIWLEFRLFMDSVFAGASDTIVDAISAVNPDIATGQPNWTWMTPMAGIDPSKIVPGRTGSQDYGPCAWVRSFKRAGTPTLTWLGYADYTDMSGKLWGALNNGATGVLLYNTIKTRASDGEGFLATTGALTGDGKILKAALRPLVNGCGDLVNFSERASMPITILYAQGGMGIAWLESDDKAQFDWNLRNQVEGSEYNNWFRSQEQWEHILNTLRLGFDYTSEPKLADRLSSAKALILPACRALSQTSREQIRAFKEKGGVVIGDRHAGHFDESGAPAKSFVPELDRCFKTVPQVNDEPTVAEIRAFFSGCGITADYDVIQVASGKPATGITCGDFRVPGGRILLLTGKAVDEGRVMKGTRVRNQQPDTELELRLTSAVYISDMVKSRAATTTAKTFRWDPEEGPCAVFITEEKPAAPKVSEPGWFRSAFCGGKQGDY